MIVYLDSSIFARAYLPDEPGHRAARALLGSDEFVLVSGTWTRVEVPAALSRAALGGRLDARPAIKAFDHDFAEDGRVTPLTTPQLGLEQAARAIAVEHRLRSLDALHIAVANLCLPALGVQPNDARGFATRDGRQAEVAEAYGYILV